MNKNPKGRNLSLMKYFTITTLSSFFWVRSAFMLGAAGQMGTGNMAFAKITLTWLVRDNPLTHQVLILSSSSISPCGARLRENDIIGGWTAWCQVVLLFTLCLIFSCAWWIIKELCSEGMSYSISDKFFLFCSGLCLTWLPSLLPYIPGTDLFTQLCFMSQRTFSARKEEEQTPAASRSPLPFLSPAPLLHPFSIPFFLISLLLLLLKSLGVWNQYWNQILQLIPRSQISEETPLYPLLTSKIFPKYFKSQEYFFCFKMINSNLLNFT